MPCCKTHLETSSVACECREGYQSSSQVTMLAYGYGPDTKKPETSSTIERNDANDKRSRIARAIGFHFTLEMHNTGNILVCIKSLHSLFSPRIKATPFGREAQPTDHNNDHVRRVGIS